MVERKIDISVLNIIKKYLEEIKKVYSIDSLVLFGSYAQGNNTENSDIDLAVISDDFTDRYDDMAKLMKLTWNIDTKIEPHPIMVKELKEKNNYFVEEILKTGVKVA